MPRYEITTDEEGFMTSAVLACANDNEREMMANQTITNEILEEIYLKVYGFSVLEGENNETLKDVVSKNTGWFEDWVYECEQRIWEELKTRGFDALDADEVIVK